MGNNAWILTKTSHPTVESLLAEGAEALWRAGDLVRSRASFHDAFLAAEQFDDGPAMAAAALGLAGLWVHDHRTSTTTAVVDDRLRRSLRYVPEDSVLALRLRARLAAASDYRGGESQDILTHVAEARELGDPIAVAETLSLAHHCLQGPEHGALRQALAEELITASSQTTRRGDLMVALLMHAVDLLLDADPHARRWLTELRNLLEVNDHLAVRYVLRAIDVMAEIRAGRLENAELLAKQCAQDGELAGDADVQAWFGAHMGAIRFYQGSTAELLPLIRAMADSPDLSPIDHSYRAALAMAAAAAGERREALGAIDAFRNGLGGIPSSSTWLVSIYALTESAFLLERADVAAEAYELLLPFRRLPMMAGFGVVCFGSVEHALGVAKLTLGDYEDAVVHLDAAVRANEALNHLPATALARHRLAYALAHSGNLEHRARSAREADMARRDASALGMNVPPLAEPEPQRLPTALSLPASAVVQCRRQGGEWHLSMGSILRRSSTAVVWPTWRCCWPIRAARSRLWS